MNIISTLLLPLIPAAFPFMQLPAQVARRYVPQLRPTNPLPDSLLYRVRGTLMSGVVKRVIIVGGGIGGLCTAIGLRQAGVDTIVYEQAEVLSQVGAGLTIWANAIKALRKLGLADEVIRAGSKIEHGKICTAGGRKASRAGPRRRRRPFRQPTSA